MFKHFSILILLLLLASNCFADTRWLCEGFCFCNDIHDSKWGFAIRDTRQDSFTALESKCNDYCPEVKIIDSQQKQATKDSACSKFESPIRIINPEDGRPD